MALLREHGVEVVVAAAWRCRTRRRPTRCCCSPRVNICDDALLRRLANVPVDLLLVEPTSRARAR
ncbi:hypothetical protein I553_3802 [Mycobacterium xenopi 4042]|uniref:Uncharacterized protein n=1 Tax=Mycobacterium xenopi 4042 TaxID=1299334 RepID=X8EYS1_MYCXE|nr:hypothetical protein I553_3802 [Mycobacterium xenopi 4042]